MKQAGKTFSALVLTLVMLALLGRSAVPAGFMPAQAQDDTVRMVICTGTGSVMATLDGKYNPVPNKHKDTKADHTCPFAPVLSQQDVWLQDIVPPFSPENSALSVRPGYALPPGDIIKPWLSQGPPAFFT